MDILETKNKKDSAKRHPWELARIKIIETIVNKITKEKNLSETTLIDTGCGDLFVIETINKSFTFLINHHIDIE